MVFYNKKNTYRMLKTYKRNVYFWLNPAVLENG